MASKPPDGDSPWSSRDALRALRALVAAALVSLGLYAAQFPRVRFLGVLGAAALTGMASFAVGGLFGLLFGLPKTASGRNEPSPGAEKRQSLEEGYGPNTNLEQISDWLTAALVGAGLTQFSSLGSAASSLGQFLAPGFGDTSSSAAVAIATVVYFLLSGFLMTYLLARMRLAYAFGRADRRARQELQAVKETIRAIPAPPEDDTETAEQSVPPPELDHEELRQLDAARRDAERLARRGMPLASDDYRRLARQLKAAGRFREAIDAYNSAFEADPSDPKPLNFAGVIASRDLNDTDEAQAFYRRALAVDPAYTSAIYNMACNEARRGALDEALTLLSVATTSRNGVKYKRLARRDAEPPRGPFTELASDPRFDSIVRS